MNSDDGNMVDSRTAMILVHISMLNAIEFPSEFFSQRLILRWIFFIQSNVKPEIDQSYSL